jgi:Cysteine dioxygenase type I
MTHLPPKRDLSAHELVSLVTGLGRRPELWAHLVRHDPSQRVYEELWRDEHVAVWLICWMHDHDTGFHDHDLSAGAVSVVSGAVCEERLRLGDAPLVRTSGAGEAFDFAASDIHRVLHAGDVPAVTLHAYSPPLRRMGAYQVREDGVLARHSVSYAEELHPLLPAVPGDGSQELVQ